MNKKIFLMLFALVLSATAMSQETIFPTKFTAPAEFNTGKVHISVLSRSEHQMTTDFLFERGICRCRRLYWHRQRGQDRQVGHLPLPSWRGWHARHRAVAAQAVHNYFKQEGRDIVYINVKNNLSVDCDCDGSPATPQLKDIGILASTDPVALDKACLDLVLNHQSVAGDDAIQPSRRGADQINFWFYQVCPLKNKKGVFLARERKRHIPTDGYPKIKSFCVGIKTICETRKRKKAPPRHQTEGSFIISELLQLLVRHIHQPLALVGLLA